MSYSTFIQTHAIASELTIFKAQVLPRWSDGLPLHLPHTLPALVLSQDWTTLDEAWPSPGIGIRFDLDDFLLHPDRSLPRVLWEIDDAVHELHLSLPVDMENLERRAAVLNEVSRLLTDMARRHEWILVAAVSTPTHIYRCPVFRHVPAGIFQADSGEALWVHPSAKAFDLLHTPFPASQRARRLSESVLGKEWGDFSQASLLDPATGLPGWAAMRQAALTNDLGRPVTLTEALDAVVAGLEARTGSEPGTPWRARATAQIERARANLFGEVPSAPPDGPSAAQAAVSTKPGVFF